MPGSRHGSSSSSGRAHHVRVVTGTPAVDVAAVYVERGAAGNVPLERQQVEKTRCLLWRRVMPYNASSAASGALGVLLRE